MLDAQLGLLREERDRLRRTVRYRVGDAVLRWRRAPWRVVRLVSDVARALRAGRAPAPAHQCREVRAIGDEAVAGSARVAALRGAWGEVEAILFSPAYRLGSRVVDWARPWRLLRRPPRSLPDRLPEPAPTRPAVARADPATAPPLAVDGPGWLRAMADAEELPREADALLLAVDGRTPPRPPPAARRLACWAVDGPPHPDWAGTLRRADAVFAADPAVAGRLRAKLGRAVETLPPAVQPLLQNPIGFWNDKRGTPAPWEAGDGDALPPDWALLQDIARTRDLDAAGVARVEALLGAPLPTPAAPAWADADTARLWVRKARLRRVWRDAALARRLAPVARALDLPAGDRSPLATITLCTNRPPFLPQILRMVGAQTHPRCELILMLHGDAFDRAEVDRLAGTLPMPVTVLGTPQQVPKGEALQIASDHARGELIVRIDDDDWYGPRHVEDFVLDAQASPAGVFGKPCVPVHFVQGGNLALLGSGTEYRYVRHGGGGGRMAYRSEVHEHVTWRRAPLSEDTMFFLDCERVGIPTLGGDRFGTVLVRRAPKQHTWQVTPSFFRRHLPLEPLPRAARPEDFDV